MTDMMHMMHVKQEVRPHLAMAVAGQLLRLMMQQEHQSC